ncbi:MAG: hypothetical protein Q8N05_16685 [Bacteroidota bacterium]|nr:hypothetical protein [Bacteroidota bacterium]
MLLPEHGYIVDKVSEELSTKDLKHQYVELILRKPAPKDEFGDTVFTDDVYQVKAWNKKIDLVKGLQKGDKVKAMLSLSGAELFDQQSSKIYYNQNLSVIKLEKLP